MSFVDQDFVSMFFVEAADHLATLEAGILQLEQSPEDDELLNALFRAAHSIKGAAGMLGFEVIKGLTHAVEGLLEALRAKTLRSTPAISSLLLSGADLVRACIEAEKKQTPPPAIDEMVAQLTALISAEPGVDAPAPVAAPSTGARTVTITFRPSRDLFTSGLDPGLCLRELSELGECTVVAILDDVPALSALDPEVCFLGWHVTLRTEASAARISEVFDFVGTPLELSITEPQAADAPPASPTDVPAPRPQPSAPRPPGGEASKDEGTLRVNTSKVDRLINLVGELVITQAMMQRSLASFTESELPRMRETAIEMQRHTRALQDGVMNIRMVPIGTIFHRFRRLVRDLSDSLGKNITIETQGEQTEIDKSVVEALADPLMHLVRNSADHGLESTADRAAAGKPEAGTITLSARHLGGNVVVEVSDDGRGLDTERIRARAVERGLIDAHAQLTEDELHRLIFAPGFSTAEKLTDLSGRGVGMDVVLRSVEALNGKIAITTERGRGTRMRISLPLTLAIIDGMSLRVGSATYVVPLSHVVETLPLHRCPTRRLPDGRDLISVRGRSLPLLHLGALLGSAPDEANPRPLAVIVESAEVQFAFAIDELVGKSQLVIKALEANYQRIQGILGATILGDGTVSFILDVQGLAALGGLVTTEARAA